MSIKDLKAAITELPANEATELTAWLVEYHHNLWDEQIANDLESGRLSVVIEQANADYRAGRTIPLDRSLKEISESMEVLSVDAVRKDTDGT